MEAADSGYQLIGNPDMTSYGRGGGRGNASSSYDAYNTSGHSLQNFLLTPATVQEAALLSSPHMQTLQYGAYGTGAAQLPTAYANNMRHLSYARDVSYEDEFTYGGVQTIMTSDGKRKRRRVITHDQRKAANVRERRRMYHLNEAFDDLRKRVPTFAYEKKLSRIETLKLAVTYIQFMSEMLEDLDAESVTSNDDSPPSTKAARQCTSARHVISTSDVTTTTGEASKESVEEQARDEGEKA